MSKKDELIQSFNEGSLGDLTIEELEERLELQILHPPETQSCYDCTGHVDCETYKKPADEIEDPNPA